MKHKRRSGGNPLAQYRRLQREIRALYDPFTDKHCPTCTTPCCVKPTRVTPVDVALALGTGHTFPHLGTLDAYAPAVEYASHRLSSKAIALDMAPEPAIEYCEYLHQGRCTFPDDLRPFGCTTYVCGPMYQNMPEENLRKIRRLLRQLDEVHVTLIHALRDSGNLPEIDD